MSIDEVAIFHEGFLKASNYAIELGYANLTYRSRTNLPYTNPKEFQIIEVEHANGFRTKLGEVLPGGAAAVQIASEIQHLIQCFEGSWAGTIPPVYEGPEAERRKAICSRKLFAILQQNGSRDEAVFQIMHGADLDTYGSCYLNVARRVGRVDIERLLLSFGVK